MKTEATIDLSPEDLAREWWNMVDADQVRFFAELRRISGHMLEFQLQAISNHLAENRNDDAMTAITAFGDYGAGHTDNAIEWRSFLATRAINSQVRQAQEELS